MAKNSFDSLWKEYPFFKDLPFFECGIGWFDLIKELCEKLNAMKPGKSLKVVQVKEKFGGLRFYVEGVSEEKSEKVYKLIAEAEEKSFTTCEYCGKPGKQSGKNWVKTLCDNCRKK